MNIDTVNFVRDRKVRCFFEEIHLQGIAASTGLIPIPLTKACPDKLAAR